MTSKRPASPLYALIGACCLALVAACFASLHFLGRAENRLLRDQQALTDAVAQSLHNQLEAERLIYSHERTTPYSSAPSSGGLRQLVFFTLRPQNADDTLPRATAIWNPSTGEGVFIADRLPLPPAEQTYQLWLASPTHPSPINGGVIPLPQDGRTRHFFQTEPALQSLSDLTLRLERQGGSNQPEGRILLATP